MNTDLDKLEQLHAKATPGPWDAEWDEEEVSIRAGSARTQWETYVTPGGVEGRLGRSPASYISTDVILEHDLDWFEDDEISGDNPRIADAEWIAAIHNAAPAIIAELREKRADAAEWKATAINDREVADEYRDHAAAMLRRAAAAEKTIERVREVFAEWGEPHGTTAHAFWREIRDAVDGEQ